MSLYKEPYRKTYPVVCMDESSKQHLREVREKLPMEPGKPERYDTEYERNGTSNLFVFLNHYVVGGELMLPIGEQPRTGLIRSKNWLTKIIPMPKRFVW